MHPEYYSQAENYPNKETIKEYIEMLKIIELTSKGDIKSRANNMIAQLEDLLICINMPEYMLPPTILN